MQIELRPASEAKLEDILEQLYARYYLDDMTPEELIDALLDMGVDMVVAEPLAPSVLRDRLTNICGHKIAGRGVV